MIKPAPATTDFEAQYDAAVSPVDPMCQVPTFAQYRQAIKDRLEEEGEHEGRVLLLGFADFEAFFTWLDTLTTYEARDNDDSIACYRAALDVIYRSLVEEYIALKACPFCSEHGANLSSNGIESDYVVCECGAEGPPGTDKIEAIIEWNQRAQLPTGGIAGYQVQTPAGDQWAGRPENLILSQATAISDLRMARKGQGQWIMSVVLDGDIENPEFEKSPSGYIGTDGEGWALFEVGTDLDKPLMEIQRDDEMGIFATDDDALDHVKRMAAAGSKTHQDALDRHLLDAPFVAR